MKTKIKHHRKRLSGFLKTLTVATLLGMGLAAKAQTGTYTVLQQPCNNDGQLSVTITSGLTPPLNFRYYDINGNQYSHLHVNSLSDILSGIGAPIQYVHVAPSTGGLTFSTAVTGMVAPFTVDNPIITNAVCPSLTGTAQITINGGTAPASVQWFNYLPSSSSTYVGTGNPMALPPGMYSAIITDAAGCTAGTGSDSTNVVYIDNISGMSLTMASTQAACTNGTASVTGITGGVAPYTYLWSNGATTPSISGLVQGAYSAIVTDAQGCNTTDNTFVPQSVSVNANPVVTNATCLQTNGSAIAFGSGGVPPYTYAWSNGMTTQSVTGISGGTNLYVTTTDANGCFGTSYMHVNSSTPITATYAVTASSCTAPTGSVTLNISGGTTPYTTTWNTFPASSGTSISGKPAGTYSFTITDAAGCVRTGAVAISTPSLMVSSAYASNPVCPATTGTVGITASSNNPPLSYLWNTGATTPSITGTVGSTYSCLITDNVGCTQTKAVTQFSSSPISVGFSSTQASCRYSADGSILANAIGGTAPYTYSWSNGQTTPTATGLATGNYYVSVQDAIGCTSSPSYAYVGYNSLNNSCYCTISGMVYNDANGNCTQDAGEAGIENIMIHCAPFGYAFTDANGNYSFIVPSGNYTLSETVQYMYPLSACQSNSIAVSVTAASGCTNTVNFANSINTIHDVHVFRTSITQPVPGNAYAHALIIRNDGTVNEPTIELAYRADGQMIPGTTSPLTYSQPNPGTDPSWYNFSGLTMPAGGSTVVYYNDLTPTNIPLTTALLYNDSSSYTAPISNWLTDFTPWNNITNYTAHVVGSYDPNFKEVSPQGTGTEGFIETSDSTLDYVVHFQNTGSYYADKVVVVDSLDADLDWTTLRPGYSDHAYTATLSENGVLTFTFEHINLDWQAQSEMGSRGLVTYSIKQKPNLAPGTEIKNSAAIYFDYNAPVITNQTLNTIQFPTGIAESENKPELVVYPNPANDVLNINLSNANDVNTIRIYDLLGRMVQSETAMKNAASQKVNVSGLVKGLYFVVLEKANGEKVTGRFVKN